MNKVYIPEKIGEININHLDLNVEELFEKLWVQVSYFQSSLFEGAYIETKELDNILPILNWYYWNRYFLGDYFNDKLNFAMWQSFWDFSAISKSISDIYMDIEKINKSLASNFLLTKSRKEKMINTLKDKIFVLSWIDFIIFSLIIDTENNLSELEQISLSPDQSHAGNADVLRISQENKLAELENVYTKLTNRIPDFIEILSKYMA